MFSTFDISCYIYCSNDTIELGLVARKLDFVYMYTNDKGAFVIRSLECTIIAKLATCEVLNCIANLCNLKNP